MIQSYKKITLHNFASYAHAEIDLSSRGFCLVSGKNNYKKDNSLSNGSGKSFIWSGICFALTGETIAGIKSGLKNKLIDEDLCYTKLEFSIDADEYEVTRYIAPKSDLHIIKNGVDVSGKGIRESEKKLGELLPDLNRDLIANNCIIGQGMPDAVSKHSPSGRKEVIERLTKSDFMIEDVKQRVARRMYELNNQLRSHEDTELVTNTKLTDATASLNILQAKKNSLVKPDFDSEELKLTDQLNACMQEITDVSRLTTATNGELSSIESKLDSISIDKAKRIAEANDDHSNTIADYYTKRSELSVASTTLQTEIQAIDQKIKNIRSIKEFCPTCRQKLVGVTKPSTIELENELAVKQASLDEITKQIQDMTNKIVGLNASKAEILRQIELDFVESINYWTDVKNVKNGQLNNLRGRMTDLSVSRASLTNAIDQLQQQKLTWDTNYDQLVADINSLSATISSLSDKLKQVTIEKEDTKAHIATVKKIETLVKRDLRGHLLSNIITYIDRRAKDFCEVVFGTRDLKIYLDGNALDISYCDKMFDNLSGGEKMRVDLILQLAIRDMLKVYLNTQSNILVLDEITDFLDKKSCAAVMQLIERELGTVESVFIVSHHADTLVLPIDTELRIVKDENGISAVI